MRSWLFLHPLGFVYFSFLLWHILPLLCVSLCCHYLRLSRGFFCLMFILISFFSLFSTFLSFAAVALSGHFCFRSRDQYLSLSFYLPNSLSFWRLSVLLSLWFYLLVVFASMSSSFFLLGLLRLAFQTPYSLLGWSVFASSSAVVLSLLLGSPFSFLCVSPFSAFLREFSLPFATSSVYPSFVLPACVSLHTALLFLSLSPRLLLLRGLAALLALRLRFSWGFLTFTGFLFGSFTSEF